MTKPQLRAFRKVYEWAKRGERPGGEFDWFAVDELEHAAVFCSAGFGGIPNGVFDAPPNAFLNLVEYFENLGRSAPRRGFTLYENCGFYVYDYGPADTGVYSRVMTPRNSLTLAQIPVALH